MILSIDTEKPSDIELLQSFVAVLNGGAPAAAAAPAAARKAAAPKAAAAPEPTPEPEAPADADPMEAAVKLATDLVAAGKAADVKKVLTDFGVKRVSQLEAGDINDFIAALS